MVSSNRTAAPGVLAQELDGETILLDSGSGTYFRLNDTGSRVWEAVLAGRAPKDVAAEIARDTGADPVKVEEDVTALLATLESRGLISTSG